MAKSPLQSLGTWRSMEGAVEAGIPLMAAGTAWYFANKILSELGAERPFTGLELAAILGACTVLTAWAVSRQMHMLRKRNPWFGFLVSAVLVTAAMVGLPRSVNSNFEERCEEYEATVVETTPLPGQTAWQGVSEKRCLVSGVAGNPYLPGTIFRPMWDGRISLGLGLFLGCCTLLGSLALRDRRLRKSRLGIKLFDQLRLAPGHGLKSGAGEPPPTYDSLQACGNFTFWGEVCGQLYSGKKAFEDGERCIRCHQAYVKSQQEVTFDVVSLFSGDVDVLNGLERIDTNSWTPGEGMPPDGRISGEERWVMLGRITVPTIASVAQVLAIVHDHIGDLPGGDENNPLREDALKLAEERASRIAAWIWTGRVNHKMTFANPAREARLAIGPSRIKDLIRHSAETLTLQLDIGLLPINMRVGFRMSFLEEGKASVAENSAFNLWVPTSPPTPQKGREGLWVPRIEGAALRSWLSTERLRPEDERGTTIPLPYMSDATVPTTDEEMQRYMARVPRPGSLDLVRMEMTKSGTDVIHGRRPGDSIAEWKWLEWQQIELLRNEALVLTETRS